MNQIITLLTNLFNLTKIASVTLPGLLAAGGLALILWPAVPVDVIPAVVRTEDLSQEPRSTFVPACTVQHWSVDDVIDWMVSDDATSTAQATQAREAEKTTEDKLKEKEKELRDDCEFGPPKKPHPSGSPASHPPKVAEASPVSSGQLTSGTGGNDATKSGGSGPQAGNNVPPPNQAGKGGSAQQPSGSGAQPGQNPPPPASTTSKTSDRPFNLELSKSSLRRIVEIEKKTNRLSVPEMRRSAILSQVVLDFEARGLAYCADLEKSWAGQDEQAIQSATIDIGNWEKQRSSAQDNYLAYLKSNNRSLVAQYGRDVSDAQRRIGACRILILNHTLAKQERERRAAELTAEQQEIKDRLSEPGRLRPRVGFDLFVTGLVNHIVGFILLSLAAALVVTAIDRAAFGAFFEDLFDGF